jgi:aconitate hydratase
VTPEALRVTERLDVGGHSVAVHRIDKIPGVDPQRLARRPLTVRILLENMLRHFRPGTDDLGRLQRFARGDGAGASEEFPFHPERILLQDFTGVPVLVDLTGLRSAAKRSGRDPLTVNPRVPVDLIVDHSVSVDSFGSAKSVRINLDREYERNGERYRLLRWAQGAFRNVRIVPPGNGICHQVNLEYLASVVTQRETPEGWVAFPDTLLGTDSHTTMVNGLSVLGWGVGGIEAEAAMLGEPYFLGEPTVVGVRLTGRLPEGATATDLVLTITQRMRAHGVVDKYIEFYGPGLETLSVPDRATISNMCPEYGATAALFPIDQATLTYLRGTGRDAAHVELVEAYARRQGFWAEPNAPEPEFGEFEEIDLGSIVPTISGPRNPEEKVALREAPGSFAEGLRTYRTAHPANSQGNEARRYPADDPLQPSNRNGRPPPAQGSDDRVGDGAVVIAAITSCTNTSNPSVMVGAGLIARRARALGLHPPEYVKTSLAPGSKVVTDYLERAGLLEDLNALGFDLVGYGCTTCIGNSGPLPPPVEQAIRSRDAYVAAVLSGNRNFEARIHNLVRANYLMSPMLVVAYALAGRMDRNLATEPLGHSADGKPIYLKDLWPPSDEIRRLVEATLRPEMFREKYRAIFDGDAHWEALSVPTGTLYPWEESSTYLRDPPYFDLPPAALPEDSELLRDARALAVLGDRVSTDHISPAGSIPKDSPAGQYLVGHGVEVLEFNTYGSRRGNHDVMVRGTFANVRIKNFLVDPKEGGWTIHLPSGATLPIFDAAERYRKDGVPLIVLAGTSYGQGSSRDWAAKGPRLLGVRAILAQSFERIHRSNLVGMGILPLEFRSGEGWRTLGLTGRETYSLRLPRGARFVPRCEVEVVARDDPNHELTFHVRSRIDSEAEMGYYRAGGLLPYVLNRLGS